MKTTFPWKAAALLALALGSNAAQASPTREDPPPPAWTGDGYVLGPWLFAQKDLLERGLEEERQRKLAFFDAILTGDRPRFLEALQTGMDPDVDIPLPCPPDFLRKINDELLRFYVAKEPGFTALMMASVLGDEFFVRTLLMAGAAPYKTTQRYKTFALWLAGKYERVEIMQLLMGVKPEDEAAKLRILVDLDNQIATLWRGDKIEFQTDISSGRKAHPTPRGRFVVTNKYKSWKSTLYPAKMPYFLRLSCGDFGLHAGYLPGYPASHGCIRLPESAAQKLFATVPVGTLVEIR